MSSVIVYKWKLLVWLNLTVQSGLNIGKQHWWPLAGNTSTLAHDTLQGFSYNNSLENSDKDPRHFFPVQEL